MAAKSIPPSINETAFDCPHCGAFTTQFWFDVYANPFAEDRRTLFLPDEKVKFLFITDSVDGLIPGCKPSLIARC